MQTEAHNPHLLASPSDWCYFNSSCWCNKWEILFPIGNVSVQSDYCRGAGSGMELIDTFASMEQTPAARIQHVENDGAEPNDFPKIQFKFIHLS